MDIVQLGIALLFSAAICALLTYTVIKLYKKFGWLDNPSGQVHPKVVHKYPVPRGGGIAIGVTIIIVSLLFLPLDKHLVGILAGMALLVIVGVLDDIFDLNPYVRIGCGVLAASSVVFSGIGIAFISNPLGGIIRLDQPQLAFFMFGKMRSIWLLADLFAFLWILTCINFVNWSKGVDGQLPGIVVIAALTIVISSFKFSADITQWPVAVLACITAGAYFGFLFFNIYPQKIMPGYGGGSIAGYILAVLSILATAKVGTAVMVLGIPMVDALYVVARRLYKGRSPVWGDAHHLHHNLLALGWGKRKIALFYWLVTLMLGYLALSLSSLGKLYTIICIGIALGGFFVWVKFFRISLRKPGRNSGRKT